MKPILFDRFGGMVPGALAHQVPEGSAYLAKNCDLRWKGIRALPGVPGVSGVVEWNGAAWVLKSGLTALDVPIIGKGGMGWHLDPVIADSFFSGITLTAKVWVRYSLMSPSGPAFYDTELTTFQMAFSQGAVSFATGGRKSVRVPYSSSIALPFWFGVSGGTGLRIDTVPPLSFQVVGPCITLTFNGQTIGYDNSDAPLTGAFTFYDPFDGTSDRVAATVRVSGWAVPSLSKAVEIDTAAMKENGWEIWQDGIPATEGEIILDIDYPDYRSRTVFYDTAIVQGTGDDEKMGPLYYGPDTEVPAIQVPEGYVVHMTAGDSDIRVFRGEVSGRQVVRLLDMAAGTDFYDNIVTPPGDEVPPCGDAPNNTTFLVGSCVMPQQFGAGFSGSTLYFSEPYAFHAWPAEYRMEFGAAITGIVQAAGHLLVFVGTDKVFQVSGGHPSSMTSVLLTDTLGLSSVQTLCRYADTVWWASTGGSTGRNCVVEYSGGNLRDITSPLFQSLDTLPEKIRYAPGLLYLLAFSETSGWVIESDADGRQSVVQFDGSTPYWQSGIVSLQGPAVFDRVWTKGLSGTVAIEGATVSGSAPRFDVSETVLEQAQVTVSGTVNSVLLLPRVTIPVGDSPVTVTREQVGDWNCCRLAFHGTGRFAAVSRVGSGVFALPGATIGGFTEDWAAVTGDTDQGLWEVTAPSDGPEAITFFPARTEPAPADLRLTRPASGPPAWVYTTYQLPLGGTCAGYCIDGVTDEAHFVEVSQIVVPRGTLPEDATDIQFVPMQTRPCQADLRLTRPASGLPEWVTTSFVFPDGARPAGYCLDGESTFHAFTEKVATPVLLRAIMGTGRTDIQFFPKVVKPVAGDFRLTVPASGPPEWRYTDFVFQEGTVPAGYVADGGAFTVFTERTVTASNMPSFTSDIQFYAKRVQAVQHGFRLTKPGSGPGEWEFTDYVFPEEQPCYGYCADGAGSLSLLSAAVLTRDNMPAFDDSVQFYCLQRKQVLGDFRYGTGPQGPQEHEYTAFVFPSGQSPAGYALNGGSSFVAYTEETVPAGTAFMDAADVQFFPAKVQPVQDALRLVKPASGVPEWKYTTYVFADGATPAGYAVDGGWSLTEFTSQEVTPALMAGIEASFDHDIQFFAKRVQPVGAEVRIVGPASGVPEWLYTDYEMGPDATMACVFVDALTDGVLWIGNVQFPVTAGVGLMRIVTSRPAAGRLIVRYKTAGGAAADDQLKQLMILPRTVKGVEGGFCIQSAGGIPEWMHTAFQFPEGTQIGSVRVTGGGGAYLQGVGDSPVLCASGVETALSPFADVTGPLDVWFSSDEAGLVSVDYAVSEFCIWPVEHVKITNEGWLERKQFGPPVKNKVFHFPESGRFVAVRVVSSKPVTWTLVPNEGGE